MLTLPINNKPLSTARPTGLTNTLIIEIVNIRHTQLVQALANTLSIKNVKYKTNTARAKPSPHTVNHHDSMSITSPLVLTHVVVHLVRVGNISLRSILPTRTRWCLLVLCHHHHHQYQLNILIHYSQQSILYTNQLTLHSSYQSALTTVVPINIDNIQLTIHHPPTTAASAGVGWWMMLYPNVPTFFYC